jgi:DNA-directed RNA polymerase subunit M/transcription elongation factor TFIIS
MLHIVKFKGCQRCGGDLFLERDSDEVYVSCLQCGAIYIMRNEKKEKEKNKEVSAH